MRAHCPNQLSTQLATTRVVLLGVVLLLAGCTRGHYRRQADQEAYGLVRRASQRTDGELHDFTIRLHAESRMFDPNCPDAPPMPPDDPTSHQLMHCVDGKHGSSRWARYGKTPFTENPDWQSYLPGNEEGQVVLDRDEAVRLALVNSREYQRELEDLYLSALDVSFERFRFDTQFFGGNSTFFTADGPDRASGVSSWLTTDTDLQMQKLFAGGGELVVGMANSLVWQFAGPDDYGANTLLDFSLVQPLLRAGGRAVVLEQLTDTERALLANIRQMERFRRGFYLQVVVGRGALAGPARGGVGIAAVSTGTVRSAGGFYGLLRQQVEIRNQRSTVAGLRTGVERMQASYDVGLATSQQVNTTLQGLLSAQSGLLRIDTEYERSLDAFKIQMGLPPELEIKIDDPLLAPFDLIDPAMADTQDFLTAVLAELREQFQVGQFKPSAALPSDLADIRRQVVDRLEMVHDDLQRLNEALPTRREELQKLSDREEVRRGDIEAAICSAEGLDMRVEELHNQLTEPPEDQPDDLPLDESVHATLAEVERFEQDVLPNISPQNAETELESLVNLLSHLADQLLTLSLIQAQARLDTVTLEPIDMEPETALRIARQCRRDWKNARADLVDTWRQIEVAGNDLESDLDVVFSGDINTKDNNPVRFRGTTGRLRVGLEFDAPLTRLVERNTYREVLIAYQQARREYYTVEDLIASSLRDTLRTIRVNQLDFEVKRAAVFVAIARVDEAQERLKEPGRGGVRFADSLARDLVTAMDSLLRDRNSFLSIWVNQEALRMNLDLDMGTMELDERGMWIDRPITMVAVVPEEIPPPSPNF